MINELPIYSLNPAVSAKWTVEEKDAFQVGRTLFKDNFKRISDVYVRTKTPEECAAYAKHLQLKFKPGLKWKEIDVRLLIKYVYQHGTRWAIIKHKMDRSRGSCFQHWLKMLRPDCPYSPFSLEERARLKELQSRVICDWDVNRESVKDIFKRFLTEEEMSESGPPLSWSDEEEEILIRGKLLKQSYQEISQSLKAKDGNDCRIRWSQLMSENGPFTIREKLALRKDEYDFPEPETMVNFKGSMVILMRFMISSYRERAAKEQRVQGLKRN